MIAATKRQKSPFRRKNEITVKIRFSEHSENRIFLNRVALPRAFRRGFAAWLCGPALPASAACKTGTASVLNRSKQKSL